MKTFFDDSSAIFFLVKCGPIQLCSGLVDKFLVHLKFPDGLGTVVRACD